MATTKKTIAKKSPSKTTAAKKTAARQSAPKKTAAKKTATRKVAPKKVAPKKVAPKKVAPKKVATSKPAAGGFDEVTDWLERILLRHVKRPLAAGRSGDELVVKGPMIPQWRTELWFGAVRRGKAYVSYHLMPVYAFPELLRGMSPGLKKRMQGKSCFNFKTVDPALFAELDVLTARCVETLRDEGFLPDR